MSNPASTLTSIRWAAVFPWLILVRAVRVSLMLRVIALALVGVVLTQAGWALVDRLLGDYGNYPLIAQLTEMRLKETPAALTVDNYEKLSLHVDAFGGPLMTGWYWPALPIIKLIHADAWQPRLAYALAGAWSIAVWALFGGAIARIAALYLTHGETLGMVAAVRSALVKWPSTAGAPAGALLGVFLVSLPLMFAGLLLRLDVFALLLGLLWIVVLIGGLALAVLVIGLMFGWPLMWATVAVERTDAFDGISRGYAYVYQRPLHAAFYVAVAGVLGLLAHWIVALFIQASFDATHWAVSAGSGERRLSELASPSGVPLLAPPFQRGQAPRETGEVNRRVNQPGGSRLGMLEAAAGDSIRFWETGWFWISKVFPMAYLFPAATGIYLLLRRHIDSADVNDVTFDEGDPERGLPTLVNSPATGVPHVAGAPPAPSPTPADPSPPAP